MPTYEIEYEYTTKTDGYATLTADDQEQAASFAEEQARESIDEAFNDIVDFKVTTVREVA